MVEQRSQLQMMLLQQSGPGVLPLSNLVPEQFLGFIRKIEQLVLEERLAPLVVYWSSQNAQRLIPSGQSYRDLLRETFCVSVFSESRTELADEWCFLLESQRLSLIIYGQQASDSTGVPTFQCAGSLDPQIVQQAFNKMLPIWQFIDLPESNRLEDAKQNLGPTGSTPQLVNYCRTEWPIIMPAAAPAENRGVVAPTMAMTHAPAPAPLPAPPIIMPGYEGAALQLEAAPAKLPLPPNMPGPAAVRLEAPASSMPAMPPPPPAPGAPSISPQVKPPAPEAIPGTATEIIHEIVGQLRHSRDLLSILQLSIERLTGASQAHRGLIWQIVGDQLAVTNEYSSSGHICFTGNQLNSQESTAIVLEFLSRFPDGVVGVISVPDTHLDTKLHKMSPTLSSLTELGDVRARLIAQLRCRGVFSGFLELQQCGQPRQWSEGDGAVIQSVAEMLSVVVQQALDQIKIETDAQEMKLVNEIANLFRESKGLKSHDMLVKSVQLVAEHTGFMHGQIYLYSADEELLIPHISDGQQAPVDLSEKSNPFVAVYESGKGQIINAEYTRKGDPHFGHHSAIVVPLMSESERLGVLGIWERLPNRPQLRPQDKDLALTIAGQLANIIRADQAIAQIRADQAREALINRVSDEIKQSLKDADEILEKLVECLQEYLDLALCVVALYDGQLQGFPKSKSVCGPDDGNLPPEMAEQLFSAKLEELKQDQIIFLSNEEIAQLNIAVPPTVRSATLVPLIHAGNFKAALCMVSRDRPRPYPEKDMKMVADLADRVAVVVSHAELFAQVERQAVTDPMTGLYNRRYFNEQLSKEIDRFQRFGRPFSYIIVDLDYLKKINDGLGHQFGDAAIKHIAAVLKKTVRDVDTAGRYGGEEFTILLPETDVASARIAADRICSAIRAEPVEGVGIVTGSVGVSTFPYDAQDRDKLAEMADQALYLAKHRGRNQVCSVSEDLVPSLKERGEEALEVQQQAVKHKTQEMGAIDLKLIAEHGILGIMGTIIKMIDQKDEYSKDRSPKAAEYASRLAQALHLSKEHITVISLAAILHNVGKSAVPEELLQKPGPLTPDERKLIEQSPAIGAKILEPAKHLHRVASVVEAYHEHWDGTGYPKGIKGEEIPLESRIIALVDAYIAMTSDRPYRKALSHDEAIKEIQQGSGKDFDPRLVKLFLSMLQKEAAAKAGKA